MRVKNAWPPVQGEDIALTKPEKRNLSTHWRVILLLAFIAIEIAGLKFAIHRPKTNHSFLFPVGRFEALLYFCLGFFLFLSGNITQAWHTLVDAAKNHHWQRIIVLQVVCYIFIIYFSSRFYPTDLFAFKEHAGKYEIAWTLALATSIFITATLSLFIIAPKTYWQRFAKTEKTKLLFALIFPASHAIISFLAGQSHDILSRPTIKVVTFILGLFYSDIRTEPLIGLVGRPNFVVIVDKMCSGYAGIGMIFVFLTWHLFTLKDKLRFPAVLLAFPIGAGLIWFSNCLRIVLLVVIGSSLSSEIAIEGFHASAGWIFFISISAGMMVIIRNSRFFSKNWGENKIVIDSVDALAIPFLIMLAATLISSSLSPEFQWLYPVRAIATGLAILLLWKHIRLQTIAPSVFSIIAGIVVFVLWIILVPSSYEEDRKFSESLSSVPTFLSVGWIVIRLLGSVIVIPIAEELAFRGYLPILFTGTEANKHRAWETQLLPFLVSSLLFGALHGSLLAGTLAGAVYYLVKLRSGRMWDAIVAHMTSNLLLSAYVLLSGHWSYW